MAGLARILDENSTLRTKLAEQEAARAKDALERARLVSQAHQVEAERDAARAERDAATAERDALQRKLEDLKASNEQYLRHFELLHRRRKMSAAERLDQALRQDVLFEATDATVPPRDPEIEKTDKAQPEPGEDGRKVSKHPRRGPRDLTKLGFDEVTVTVKTEVAPCPGCGGSTVQSERVSYRVEHIPASYVLHKVVQEVCSCEACKVAMVAPEPYLLPGSMCADGLLATVLTAKFGDHIPLHRQAKQMKRRGFTIGTNVLCGWVRRAYEQVEDVVAALRLEVAQSPVLLSDDTGFPVQDGSDGTLTKGRLWVFTDQEQAFFAFSRTKEGEHPLQILAPLDAEGTLVCDGGSEYDKVGYVLDLTRGGCWSHLRRYFFDASIHHADARVARVAIRDLFLIERALARLTPDERLAQRRERALPIVDGLYAWIREIGPSIRPKSKLGKACGYALGQEQRMRVFLEDGTVPLHNNLSELLLRQPVIGRKNWLFAGSEGGAEAAAGWFSLISSAVMQGLDPELYLYNLFKRLPDHPSTRLVELTPKNWKAAVAAGELKVLSPGQFA